LTLFVPQRHPDDFHWVIETIHNSDIPISRLVTHHTSLKAVDAIPVWAAQKSGLIKALIEIAE
jgi:threonine dehydrogenase-like Zn-dependent dehydrogenase